MSVQHKQQCGVVHEESGLRCTKKADHYPNSKHGNMTPGREVEWVSETAIEKLKKLVGKTVRVTGIIPNDPAPLEIGDEGIVAYVDDGGTVWPEWNSGRSLGLLPTDPYEVID